MGLRIPGATLGTRGGEERCWRVPSSLTVPFAGSIQAQPASMLASRVTMGSPTVCVLSRGCTRPAARAMQPVGQHISSPPTPCERDHGSYAEQQHAARTHQHQGRVLALQGRELRAAPANVRLPLLARLRPSLARKHAPSQRKLCIKATAEPLDMDPLEKYGSAAGH